MIDLVVAFGLATECLKIYSFKMLRGLFAGMLLIFVSSLSEGRDTCSFPSDCARVQASFQSAKQKSDDRKKFREFIALLEKSALSNCEIKGVVVKVPGYRTCYDGGFTTKTDSHGSIVKDQDLKGPLQETLVHDWFVFAKGSTFPEGKRLIRSKAFQSTLDGYWAEDFLNAK